MLATELLYFLLLDANLDLLDSIPSVLFDLIIGRSAFISLLIIDNLLAETFFCELSWLEAFGDIKVAPPFMKSK